MPGGGSKPGERRGGRKKGTPNKFNASVKAAIIEAFERAGGADYLLTIAHDDPKTFCALLGRVLPMQVTGEDGGAIKSVITVEYVNADQDS